MSIQNYKIKKLGMVIENQNYKIDFLQISDVIETCMSTLPFIPSPGYNDYVNTDKETRIRALEYIR